MHADQTLSFLENLNGPHLQTETVDEPSLVRPLAVLPERIDSGVDLPLEAPIEALDTAGKPPSWPRNDVRGQILTWSVHSTTVAEIAARLSLPLGATRFLVDDLVSQGYLRVRAPLADSSPIDERRELLTRTLAGLRAL